ncbi:MAG TPA: HutD family protein [Rhizomicrobium sp.]|jgi:hypothetical protein|nr:HutD family protein [Rhizomicrobium sp.]
MQILYAKDRVAQPWKNGGGVTREVVVFPRGASFENFGWRVSIATVERGGPFSVFPGIDRTIALFDGRVSLAIAGRESVELSRESEPLTFAGDAATHATLIGGPVTDLNVMTRRGQFTARMTRQRPVGSVTFGSHGAATVALALAPVTIGGGAEMSLAAGDALFAEPGAPQTISLSSGADFHWIEIFAAPPQ